MIKYTYYTLKVNHSVLGSSPSHLIVRDSDKAEKIFKDYPQFQSHKPAFSGVKFFPNTRVTDIVSFLSFFECHSLFVRPEVYPVLSQFNLPPYGHYSFNASHPSKGLFKYHALLFQWGFFDEFLDFENSTFGMYYFSDRIGPIPISSASELDQEESKLAKESIFIHIENVCFKQSPEYDVIYLGDRMLNKMIVSEPIYYSFLANSFTGAKFSPIKIAVSSGS